MTRKGENVYHIYYRPLGRFCVFISSSFSNVNRDIDLNHHHHRPSFPLAPRHYHHHYHHHQKRRRRHCLLHYHQMVLQLLRSLPSVHRFPLCFFLLPFSLGFCLISGGVVAQWIERATSGQEVMSSIPVLAPCWLGQCQYNVAG